MPNFSGTHSFHGNTSVRKLMGFHSLQTAVALPFV